MILRLIHKTRVIGILFLLLSILSLAVPSVLAQDTNVCRDLAPPVLEYGDSIVGVISAEVPLQLYCFEAERGDEVTVTIEPQSNSLITEVFISTPFITVENQLADDPIAVGSATTLGGDVEITAEIDDDGTYMIFVQSLQDTTGNFELELEVGEALTLAGNNTDDNEGDETSDGDAVPIEDIIPGVTNLCNTEVSSAVTIGEPATGTLPQDGLFPTFICFEANAGDVVTVEAITTDGNAEMAFFITTPLWNFDLNAGILAQTFAEDDDSPAITDFIAQQTGQYVIILLSNNERGGDYQVTVTSEVANVYTCDNAPLDTLSNVRWGALGEDGETALVIIDFGCATLLSVSALGAPSIERYTIQQDGTLILFIETTTYETISVSDDEWVIESNVGEQFTLTPLTDPEACSTDELQQLVQGSWLWEIGGGQQIIMDFTCGGLVIMDFNTEFIAVPYTYDIEDERITIDFEGEILDFEEVEFDDDELEAELDGVNVDLLNLNYVEPEENEEE